MTEQDVRFAVENSYDLQVSGVKLLDQHFGTRLYTIDTDKGKFVVKILPLSVENVNDEGLVTGYLYDSGLQVARLVKHKGGKYVAQTAFVQFTIQEYIEGATFSVNEAPGWLLDQSAAFLGKANCMLKDYGQMPLRFGKDFFSGDTVLRKKSHYHSELERAKEATEHNLIPLWEEQIRHFDRISEFDIDVNRLIYANSHGDYHVGQIIAKQQNITVVDWTSACCLPVCLDVMAGYVFASRACKNGVVDAEGLRKYIGVYTKYFPLQEYDVKRMPYVFYFWLCICNYLPSELATMPENYKPMAKQSFQLLNWFYENVERLSAMIG